MRFACRIALFMTCLLATASLGQMVPTDAVGRQSTTMPATVPASQPSTQPIGFWQLVTSGQGEFDIREALRPQYWTAFIQDAITWTIGFIPRVISAIFLFLVFYFIYRTVKKVILGGMKAAGVDESIRDMLSMLLKWGILGFGLIIAGNQIGIQIAALLTGVSIIGLAVGWAAQETLANFIAGIMIFWDKPFKVGDWVQAYGQFGQIKRVTFRSTRMVNMDGDVVVMPNVKMLQETVINKSINDITRATVSIGIAYKESIEHARGVLLQLVNQDARIQKAPEPEVVVKALGDSSVDLVLHFWIKEERYEDAMQYEYTERAKIALDQAGIEIPFPHMQMLLQNPPELPPPPSNK